MQRRGFLVRLTQACAALGTLPTTLRASLRSNNDAPLHPRDRRTAGSYHHDCHAILLRPRTGNSPTQHHQPNHPHDERAVETFRDNRKLDHLPHLDNVAASLLKSEVLVTQNKIGKSRWQEEKLEHLVRFTFINQ